MEEKSRQGVLEGAVCRHLATAPNAHSPPARLEAGVAAHEARVGGVEGGDEGGKHLGAMVGRHEEQNLNHRAVQDLR